MPKFIDITGNRYGRLTVVRRAKNLGATVAWLCQCDCGNKKIIRGSHLKGGLIKSCGCIQTEVNKNRKHNKTFSEHNKTCGIYCVENLLNGKKYIGQSVNIHKRFIQHKNRPFNRKSKDYNTDLYTDIRNLGLENFSFTILEAISPEIPLEFLHEREIFWIKKFDTFYNGYNKTRGGYENPSLLIEQNELEEIYNLLKNTKMSQDEIATKFGITQCYISYLNVGKYLKQDGVVYPIRKKSDYKYNNSKADREKLNKQR